MSFTCIHVINHLTYKHRIMERAYALRDARESERMKIVKQKYDAQWRDACDDARTLDSKAMTLYMNQERLRQIEEKRMRNKGLSAQENAFVEEWTKQMDALAARDEAKKALRRQIDAETSAHIKSQIEKNAQLKEEFNQKKLQEELEDLNKVRCFQHYVVFKPLTTYSTCLCSCVRRLKPLSELNERSRRPSMPVVAKCWSTTLHTAW